MKYSFKEKKKEMKAINDKNVLTMTSAITRGCLRGLQRNAMNLVKATTKIICTINRGSA